MFIVSFFQRGGLFMFPILLVLLVGLAIAFERWVHLKRAREANQKMWDSLYPTLEKGDFDKAREMTNKDKSSMAQMLGMGLARQGAVRRREDIEIAMEESMMEIIPQLESAHRTWHCSQISPPYSDYSAQSWVLSRPSLRLPLRALPKRPHCSRPAFRRP